MATTNVQLRLKPSTIDYLDRMAAQACASVPGASATRASVAAALLDRAADAANEAADKIIEAMPDPDPHVWPQPSVPPGFPPPTPLSDVERLRRAMGDLSPGTLDRTLGVAKGTCRNARAGGVSLAAAGGGKVLAWVEAYEARAGG